MANSPEVSIIIPTFNGAPWLQTGLEAIFAQTLADQIEVILIDSGSKDNTLKIASQFPVQVLQIEQQDFNHGLTRNLGVKHAKGKFIVMTVQDARPSDNRWLEKLLNGFTNAETVGVCGIQIVAHELDKNPVKWFRPQSPASLYHFKFKNAQEFERLSPEDQRQAASWDNVNAIYHREILLKYPFREVNFAEDALWAKEVLKAGYQLSYNTNAKVYHYHHQTPNYTFKRTLSHLYHQYKLFNFLPEKGEVSLRKKISWFKTIFINTPGLTLRDKLFWWKHNLEITKSQRRAFQTFTEYQGINEEALDTIYKEICSTPPVSLNTLSPLRNE